MTFKTIFTAMTSFDPSTAALAQAAALTEALDAHLDVMCVGMDRSRSNYYEVGANAILVQTALEEAHRKAEETRGEVEAWLQTAKLRWTAVDAVATLADAGRPLALAARFADLGVAPLPYRKDSSPEETLILEAMLFDAACPTVVMPDVEPIARPERIVIGWNESTEALRAIRSALPFLMAAKEVHIAIIDPPEHAANRSDPGGALAVMLSRHGVNCDIQVMSRNGARVSERLQRHVTEMGAEMLVMGAYGHSRFREAILGGATRETLEHAKVPVFMAH
ncbi:universal stress protein [Roseobacter sinensis]|uniref:Universal stress protein n=1 Tax=Roseobacter sinensis TaxID=2931391 RepID=A0ABT3BEX1_9RHOB|nr:universal stress protein [Roseobacter sp. WL0113]MCV3271733.1 universal stress protein [Roseobacter sp. WL0113]